MTSLWWLGGGGLHTSQGPMCHKLPPPPLLRTADSLRKLSGERHVEITSTHCGGGLSDVLLTSCPGRGVMLKYDAAGGARGLLFTPSRNSSPRAVGSRRRRRRRRRSWVTGFTCEGENTRRTHRHQQHRETKCQSESSGLLFLRILKQRETSTGACCVRVRVFVRARACVRLCSPHEPLEFRFKCCKQSSC